MSHNAPSLSKSDEGKLLPPGQSGNHPWYACPAATTSASPNKNKSSPIDNHPAAFDTKSAPFNRRISSRYSCNFWSATDGVQVSVDWANVSNTARTANGLALLLAAEKAVYVKYPCLAKKLPSFGNFRIISETGRGLLTTCSTSLTDKSCGYPQRGLNPIVAPPKVGPWPFKLWIYWTWSYIFGNWPRAIPADPEAPKNQRKNSPRADVTASANSLPKSMRLRLDDVRGGGALRVILCASLGCRNPSIPESNEAIDSSSAAEFFILRGKTKWTLEQTIWFPVWATQCDRHRLAIVVALWKKLCSLMVNSRPQECAAPSSLNPKLSANAEDLQVPSQSWMINDSYDYDTIPMSTCSWWFDLDVSRILQVLVYSNNTRACDRVV